MKVFSKFFDFVKLINKGSLEHKVLSTINSKFVQNSFLNQDVNEKKIHSFMTLQQNGTLEDVINSTEFLTYVEKYNIAYQILQGVKDIHSSGIIHRDIKPDNILLDRFMNAKITDFGASTKIDDLEAKIPGSIVYSAPETLQGPSNYKCDLYSVGLVFYFLFYEKHPFNEFEIDQIMSEKQKGTLPTFPKNDDPCYEFLIRSLCTLNPDDRPNDDEALFLLNYPSDGERVDRFEFRPELDWSLLIHIFNNDEYPYLIDTIHPIVKLARFVGQEISDPKKYLLVSAALDGYSTAIQMLEALDFIFIKYDIDNICFNVLDGFALDEADRLMNFLKQFSVSDYQKFEQSFSRYPNVHNYFDPIDDESFSPLMYMSCVHQNVDIVCPIAIDIFDLLKPIEGTEYSFKSIELIATSLITGSYLEQDLETGLGLLFMNRFESYESIGPLILRLCLVYGALLARDAITAFESFSLIDPIFGFIAMSIEEINEILNVDHPTNVIELVCNKIYRKQPFDIYSLGAAVSLNEWLFFSEDDDFNISIEPDFANPLSYSMWKNRENTPMISFPPSTYKSESFDTIIFDDEVFDAVIQIKATPIVGKIEKKFLAENCNDTSINMVSLLNDLYQNKHLRGAKLENNSSMFYTLGNLISQNDQHQLGKYLTSLIDNILITDRL